MAKEILIVDSDAADQEEFKRIFDTAGFHLVFSGNGEDALFRVRLFKPDLIIATLALAEKTGLELCETVKTNPQFQDVPFVLLTEIFEDVSDEDRRRVQADGILSKPFERNEVLDLVGQLISKGGAGAEGWGQAEDDEEIIELFDVVEEPEPQVSIDDLIAFDREIRSPEIQEKLPDGSPPEEERFSFAEVTEITKEEPQSPPKEGLSPQNHLLEEMELEEILEKVEQRKPTIEEEEKPVKKEIHRELEPPSLTEMLPEDLLSLEEFETNLKAPVTAEAQDVDLQEFFLEDPRVQGPADTPPKAMTLEEELALFEESFEEPKTQPPVETAPLQKAGGATAEEEPAVFEEPLEEPGEQPAMETLPPDRPAGIGVEEELTLFEEPLEKLEERPAMETVPPQEATGIGVEEELALFEESLEDLEEQPAMETLPSDKPANIGVEEEELSELSEEEFPEALLEEVLKEEEIGLVGIRKEKEIGAIEETATPVIPKEAISPLVKVVDRKIEDVITKALQNMMEDFITKVVPEMAQNVVILTVERIEKMVKEIVPELTEKAIQEEIKRLQKGEKD